MQNARLEPNKKIFIWTDSNAKETKSYTNEELLVESKLIANFLLTNGLRQGDRVLLCYFPSLDVVPVLVACLLIGIIPVPLPPPNLNKLDTDLVNLHNFIKSCSPTALLTHNDFVQAKRLANLKNFFNFSIKWPDIKWLQTDGLKPGKPFEVSHNSYSISL